MLKRWYALSPLILQWFLWPIVRPLFSFFGRFEVRGIEHVDNAPRGSIFAANHTGELDAIFIPAAMSFFHHIRPFFYTSREQAFYSRTGWRQHFYGGWLFKALGAYPVEPGKHDYEKSLATHIRLAKEGMSVIVFPEGRVCDEVGKCEGKGGVAYLAHRANVPVIPVAISGSYRLTKGDFFGRKRKFIISFGAPLVRTDLFPRGEPVVGEGRDDFKAASATILGRIQALYASQRSA